MTTEKPSLLVYAIVGFAITTVGFVAVHQPLAMGQKVTLSHVVIVTGALVISFVLKKITAGAAIQRALWAIDYLAFGMLLNMLYHAI